MNDRLCYVVVYVLGLRAAMESKTTVIICTKDRASVLDDTLRSLLSQPTFESDIIVSIGSKESLLPETASLANFRLIDTVSGLTRQRNVALASVKSKYSLFIDDDVELDTDYIGSMEQLFDRRDNIALATGVTVLDRYVTRTLVTREMAVRALKEAVHLAAFENTVDIPGHNMFVRTELAQSLRFDERLQLYGYLEDFDFAIRCRAHGITVLNREARAAHLRVSVGRISEVQMGYSQFANPWYLKEKGILRKRELVGRFLARPFSRNLFESCVASGSNLVDRRARLKGNVLAIMDLLRGQLDPEKILSL